MLAALRQLTSLRQRHVASPVDGYAPLNRAPAPVDSLPDARITDLNDLLPWACFTVDAAGRRIGRPASVTKRPTPQAIPDERIVRLNELVDLSDKHVVELGCFEGVHTIALCDLASRVTAVDARVENVVKTMTRTWLYGHQPELVLQDVEDATVHDVYACDVLHHNGVLYHLLDPVAHLRRALARTRTGLLLDTHFSRDSEATSSYEVEGESFAVKDFTEHPDTSPFAGVYSSARWLRLDDLRQELCRAGFDQILVEETREERNGARVLFIARRSSPPDEL
jgi:2-polyprenyl-3-methyl-5-hydroxy-6-metoxy-1,4-benzoquinol methylase